MIISFASKALSASSSSSKVVYAFECVRFHASNWGFHGRWVIAAKAVLIQVVCK